MKLPFIKLNFSKTAKILTRAHPTKSTERKKNSRSKAFRLGLSKEQVQES